mgnify:CR=1 FL=1
MEAELDKETSIKLLKAAQEKIKNLSQEMSVLSGDLIKAKSNLGIVLNTLMSHGSSAVLEEIERLINFA